MIGTVDRCPTGIPGFDEICNGGLVRNNIYLVKGGPGAGKTIFLLEFLWNGLAYRENGLFLTFETDLLEVFKDANTFDWGFEKYDQAGNCKFIRLPPGISAKEIEKQLLSLISKYDVKRVCIDPANLYTMNVGEVVSKRQIIYDLISLLKRLKVTVLLSEESFADFAESSGGSHSILEFVVDGVIEMHSLGVGGEADRAIRISKMRRSSHIREPVPMKITDQGIYVLSESVVPPSSQ